MITANIHIETIKQFVPALRFNQFKKEWTLSKLGDVTKYVKGFAFKSDDYQDCGVRIVRVSDLAADRIKTDNDKLYIDAQKALDLDKYKLRTGNIVITTVGSKPEMLESAVGRGIYIHNDNEGLLNQNMLKFENIEGVSNGFIMGLINSRRYQHYMKGIARGNANQANITVVDLLQYNISYPSLPEQQKIASFLSAVDQKIQQLTKKKALLEQYKKGVMQQLFSGQLRFKDENGNDYPEWEGKRLGEIATFFKGKGISKADLSDEGILECIRYGELYTVYGETIIEVFSRTNVPEKELVLSEKDDVIIPGSGETQIDIATASCVLKANIALGGDLNIIRSANDGVFLAYYLNSALKFDIARLSQGVSVVHLYSSQLKTLKIGIPQIEEQQKIATYLSRIDTKIGSVTNQITQTQTFKKGLLQQMFVAA